MDRTPPPDGADGESAASTVRPAEGFDFRTFAWLVGAGLVGVLAIIPYQFAIAGGPPDVPPAAIVINALFVNGILIAFAVLIGLSLGRRAGLSVYAPARIPGRRTAGTYGRGVVVGLVAGAAIVLLDLVVFVPFVRDAVVGGAALQGAPTEPPAWAALLAGLYGGLTEELLLRFGLMSLLVWVVWRLPSPADDGVSRAGAWAAIVLTALVFGAAHLPATAAVFELTPAVVVRAFVLNGIGGVAFGWLYWRFDLVSAMVAHFAADVVVHVLVPMVG